MFLETLLMTERKHFLRKKWSQKFFLKSLKQKEKQSQNQRTGLSKKHEAQKRKSLEESFPQKNRRPSASGPSGRDLSLRRAVWRSGSPFTWTVWRSDRLDDERKEEEKMEEKEKEEDQKALKERRFRTEGS